MAGYGWGARHSVKEWLFAEGHRFGFYQAVRLLEMLQPEATPVGEGADPHREPVRFRSSPSFAFPASEVQELKEPFDPVMTVNFLGLAGALGPLPPPYTERVLRRLQAGDRALADFLDIFNHRLVSMMYRIRRKHRVGIEPVSPEKSGFAWYLQALMGMGPDALKDRLKVPDRALLRYAGLLSREPRSTSILCVILSDFFAAKVVDRQLRGAYRDLDEEQYTAIGETGRNQRLGQDAVLGARLWDQHAGIELEVGPVGWGRYRDFLPGRPGFVALCQTVRFYLGPSYDFDVTLKVQAAEVQPTRLRTDAPPADGPRLGWTAWLGVPPGEVVVVPVAKVRQFQDGPRHLVPDPEPVDPADPGDAPRSADAAPGARTGADELDAEELDPADVSMDEVDGVVMEELDSADTNPNWHKP